MEYIDACRVVDTAEAHAFETYSQSDIHLLGTDEGSPITVSHWVVALHRPLQRKAKSSEVLRQEMQISSLCTLLVSDILLKDTLVNF